ncbi:spiro-SPASM protein [Salinispira pacifica]|uniref:4Fe4S-binding SPASM domain-containing protein n=1 Tax=Salinispira pacifica TaxID=1307761 RepID=V5WHJ6_9SPIO|nr:spiro-SPASM protein [Salinispira pacifica]AHC15288.1 hypothetical protein L21SP2_1915 [Salinispira pacifica]
MKNSGPSQRVFPVVNFSHPRTVKLDTAHLQKLATFLRRFVESHDSVHPRLILIVSPEEIRSSREQAEITEFETLISTIDGLSVKTAPIPGTAENEAAGRHTGKKAPMSSLLKTMEHHVGEGYSPESEELPPAVFHFWADAAFLNLQVNSEILGLHETYLSEYVFAEGFPGGVSGVLVSREIFPKLIQDAGELPATRDGFFNVILKDINAYDIETVVSPADLRMLRLELYRDRTLNSLICDSLSPFLNEHTTAEDLCAVIEENRSAYRSLPAHIMLEISGSRRQHPSYLPSGGNDSVPESDASAGDPTAAAEDVSVKNFRSILDSIVKLVEDPVITLGARNEPALHRDFPGILSAAAEYTDKVSFVIETSGIGWTPRAVEALNGLPRESVNLIVCLDAVDPQLYAALRGSGYEEAMGFIDLCIRELNCGLYVQAVRMKDNEEHLMNFYNHWKGRDVEVIIQKYNDFSQTLPDRKVTDLSPLNRHECWHLKRELYIRLDGEVFACPNHALIPGEETFNFGNVYTDNMNSIWEAGRHLYLRHLEDDLPEVCRKCDEWYTFNF